MREGVRGRGLLADRRGVVALEFALVGPAFIMLLLFIIGAGLLLWGKGTMQMVASETARCAAIGSSDCSDAQAYATSLISNWGASAILPSVSVTVQSGTSCNGAYGKFSDVTISSTADGIAQMIPAFAATVLRASACYPSGR